VDDDIGQGAVPGQQAGRHEGEAGILHPAEGEGGRHEQDVVPAGRSGRWGQTHLLLRHGWGRRGAPSPASGNEAHREQEAVPAPDIRSKELLANRQELLDDPIVLLLRSLDQAGLGPDTAPGQVCRRGSFNH